MTTLVKLVKGIMALVVTWSVITVLLLVLGTFITGIVVLVGADTARLSFRELVTIANEGALIGIGLITAITWGVAIEQVEQSKK